MIWREDEVDNRQYIILYHLGIFPQSAKGRPQTLNQGIYLA